MAEARCYSPREIAACCDGRLVREANVDTAVIARIAPLHEADASAVSWIVDESHLAALKKSQAGWVVGPESLVASLDGGIIVTDTEAAVADLLDLMTPAPHAPPIGVHPTALVDASAVIGSDVAIGALAVIGPGAEIASGVVIHEGVSLGRNVRIGANSVLYDRVVLYDNVDVGANVIIHAGAVLGADGFGYIHREGRHRKLAHLGRVVIEDDVEIGANSCIDRAKCGATRIGRGSKIDDLVMIAHNVEIGALCILAGQVGLSGSVRLGKGVMLGGQCGATHGITLGDGVQAVAQTGAVRDVEPGQVIAGMPATAASQWRREQARLRKLPDLFQRVAELEKRIAELEAAADHPETRGD